jgi:hypothetical protein
LLLHDVGDGVVLRLDMTDGAKAAREVIAQRIIELAQQGERSPKRLRDRVMQESGLPNGSERSTSLVGSVNADRDARILVAEAQVARQRDLVARLKAGGCDTSEAKSMLSGLRYSLRLLKQHQRRSKRSGPDVPNIEQTP